MSTNQRRPQAIRVHTIEWPQTLRHCNQITNTFALFCFVWASAMFANGKIPLESVAKEFKDSVTSVCRGGKCRKHTKVINLHLFGKCIKSRSESVFGDLLNGHQFNS